MNIHQLTTALNPLPVPGPNLPARDCDFDLGTRLDAKSGLGRTGVLYAVHGETHTPTFIPVGTKTSVKALVPETLAALGAQAVLANVYHLHLQPGPDLVDEVGELGFFMNWPGPIYTGPGGPQVLSLGAGFKKVLSQGFSDSTSTDDPRLYMQAVKTSEVVVDEDRVVFRSYINGIRHRLTTEVSMRIQYELGSGIISSFDKLTSLLHSRSYQEESLECTHAWARCCLRAHARLTEERADRPYQQLWGIVQEAQYEDFRQKAARAMAETDEGG